MNHFNNSLPALFCIMIFLPADNVLAADEVPRTIVGYSSELSVRAGDTVDFMVNSFDGGSYQADLVRVINGDSQSRYGDKFEVVDVEAPFEGNYEGNPQPLNLGSYVHVEDASALDGLKSFTVAAWILPTFDPTEYTPPDLDNIDPFNPPSLNIADSIHK